MRLTIAVVLFVSLCSTTTFGESRYSSVYRKQDAKAASRWSLNEFLEQQDRMRLMDLWLVLHSPSPLEFFLTANYQWGRTNGDNYYTAWNTGFAAYITMFGVQVERELSQLSTRTNAIFNWRIFGYQNQGLNFTLQGGAKYEERNDTKYWVPLFGFDLTIYVSRYFGFEGMYRHFLETNVDVLQSRVAGNRYEGMLFLDFKFVRLFGGYYYENEKTAGSPDFVRKGGEIGTKFFF